MKRNLLNSPLKFSFYVGAIAFIVGFSSYPLLIKQELSSSLSAEQLQVCFTPTQSCLPKIIQAIDQANTNINLLGYAFTSKPITQALIQAKQRGVKIRIVLDHSQQFQKHAQDVIRQLYKAKIEVRFDHSVAIAHNKVLIIDEVLVITGSYNWSHAAEFKNAENLVFIPSKEISKQYSQYFITRWNVSNPIAASHSKKERA